MCQLSLVAAFGVRDLSSLTGDGNSVLSIGRQILKFLTHLTPGKSPKEDFRYVAFMTLAMSPKTHWQACGCLFRGLRPRTKAPETRRCCLSVCLSLGLPAFSVLQNSGHLILQFLHLGCFSCFSKPVVEGGCP